MVEHWLRDSYFDCPPPRWHPRGVKPERFLAEATRMAMAADWSVRDMLCTATHFIAEMVARSITRRLPEDAGVQEIIISGGLQQNGMLLRELGSLTGLPMIRLTDMPMPAGSFEAASIALLAALHIDETPADATSLTKVRDPRVLGRLTIGSPQSRRLFTDMCRSNAE
jgi:anhydro-N-acetylmuramic acid kinase